MSYSKFVENFLLFRVQMLVFGANNIKKCIDQSVFIFQDYQILQSCMLNTSDIFRAGRCPYSDSNIWT